MRVLLSLFVLAFATYAQAGGPAVSKQSEVATTPTGIELDTDWKKEIYAFAKKNVVHPSWGTAHSERNYHVTLLIAQKQGLTVDKDILFAAAFLHDLGGMKAFAQPGVDHAKRSVEVIEPLLSSFGFPSEKWQELKEVILGHTYYGPKPASRLALAFRDADIVDFLGAIGVARILAVTGEPGFADGTLSPTVGLLKSFSSSMVENCSSAGCRELAETRTAEMAAFLSNLDRETFGGAAL